MPERCYYCPACRKAHPWSVAASGQVVRCECGRMLRVPQASQDVPPVEDTYDLQDAPGPRREAPAPVAEPDDTAEPVATARRASAKPMLKYQSQDTQETTDWRALLKGPEGKQLIIPIAFAAMAIVVRFGLVFLSSSSGTGHMLGSMGVALLTMVMNTVTLFIAVGTVARFTGVELGPLPVVAVKLMSAGMLGSVAMGVAVYLEMRGVGAGAIAIHCVALLYWVLFSFFFREMDLQENLMAVVLAGLMQSGTICLLWTPSA